MGYYSNFQISKHSSTPITDSEQERLDAITQYEFFLSGGELELDDAKWYDWAKDMTKFSKEYPEEIWCVRIDGEEADDLSMQYFCNGKHQDAPAVTTFDPPNLDKLGVKPKLGDTKTLGVA